MKKQKNIPPPPPPPPLSRIIKEGANKFCKECGSSVCKEGFLGIFGEWRCINQNCNNSKSKKIYK
jgi:hypothetical protein